MNVRVEDVSSVKKKVQIEVPGERVTKEINAFYGDLQKKARIKGFRPGRVPRNILELHFKDYVRAEVLQKLIQESYPEALTEAHLDPVGQPVFDPGDLENGKPFQYSATVEVKPDIRVEGYVGLKVEGKKEEVTEADVEERLQRLQNLHAQLKTLPEPRPIQKGDYVILDYETSTGGKPLEEGKGLDVAVEVGSEHFIPAVEEKLIGLPPDSEHDMEVSFPEDYGYKKWAGKTLLFHIKIKEIKEKVLPTLDDEFARDLGDFDSLDALRARLKEDVSKEKERALKLQLREQILDQLVKMNPFEAPPSLIDVQSHAMISETKMKFASQGVDLKDLGVSDEKLQQDVGQVAEKQVRNFLLLEKIAAQEGIIVSDEEVEGRLREISEKAHQKVDAVKRYYEKNGLIPELKAGLLGDKTLDFLLEKATVTYA